MSRGIPFELTVGRARDLERVSDRLVEVRVCCLTGPVGVGKSHLAQRAAGALAERFPQGVFVCDAAGLQTENELAALFDALALPAGAVLLVVDGADACGAALRTLLPRWLAQHAQRRALVTARERTGLPGEAVIPLEPLTQAEGVALFIDRARAQDDRFAPTASERRAIGEIVRRVDALPLAICLCAAQTLVLRPPALLDHLRRTDAALDARVDGHSLRSILDAGFALLPPDARSVLVACSIFEGAFTFEAAVAVADASLAPLMVLCQRSFVRPTDEGGVRRFRLYRPMRDFAAGQGVDDALRDRHRAHYLARLDAAASPEDADEIRQNLLASAANDVETGDAPRALQTLVAVTPLVRRLGPAAHALALLGRAWPDTPTAEVLHAAGVLCLLDGQLARAAELLDAALTPLSPDAPLRAEVLAERATAARLLGHADAATAQYVLALAEPAVTPAVAARTLERLAGHLFEQGQREAARARFDEARERYAAQGDAAGIARVQHALGLVAQEDGDLAAAAAFFRDAQVRHAALGDERFAAIARFDEGALHLEGDAPGAARPVLEEAVERLEAVGDRRQTALGRALLGVCATRLDEPDRAQALLAEALACVDGMGDAAMQAAIRIHLGHLDASPAQALARLPEVTASDEERYAARVLTRAVEQTANTLTVATDGAFLRTPEGVQVALKSEAARRILRALVEHRAQGPAAVLSADALFRVGWPGERVLTAAARNRLQVALSMLRKAGLAERLVRTAEGYRLVGAVRVEQAPRSI